MRFRDSLPLIVALALIAIATLRPASGPNQLELGLFRDFSSFRHPTESWAALGVLANVALFVPLGLALALRGTSGRRAVILGLSLSTAIELAQLLIPGRTTSTDDVIANTVGCALGWSALLTFSLLQRRRTHSARPHATGPQVAEQRR